MDASQLITVGVITPHAAGGPETELPGMAPACLRVHTSRTTVTPSSESIADEPPRSAADLRALATPAVLDRAVSAFPAGAGLDVLAMASTSSGYALGPERETALVARLEERWGLTAYATCRSTVSALRSHRIRRVSLVHPPWFGTSLNRLGADYFAGLGFDVVDARLANLCHDPERIRPAAIAEWVSEHLDPRAEAVVIGGNGFRAAHAVRALEASTGRLVLEANQVLLWSVLPDAREVPPIRGFGKLFNTLKKPRNPKKPQKARKKESGHA